MRKRVYSIFIIMLLYICSLELVSCEAITAQNININSAGGANGGQRMNGGPRPNGGSDENNRNLIGEMMNADIMGKIISIDGNSINIELIEQPQNSKSSNINNDKQNANSNQNNDNNNKQSQRGFQRNVPEMNYTGTYKTITVGDDVNIAQELNIGRENQNDDLKSSIKISDLKKDQIIMIWYKENTETVDRISVVQS
ncbi:MULTISPECIES: hypothetical protein [unclassified Clostridium]|uniref:hypothetical protein n=1 Tax=unclassified Clostridium TaxID=2614128 RepID=UPI00029771C6|nr:MULTISPECIES: hypothetical protein [unclassified Clostridium]EKQ58298.1 MAG: hypothetical protein A370_00014 [Clostridium sp. Maddingley MBC34-26]